MSKIDFLDVSMPLLLDSSLQTSISIAQLLANAVRSKTHKAAVTEWLPPADRLKVKGKRGWEVPSTTKLNSPNRLGGWVVRNLTTLLRSRDNKVLLSCVANYLF
jgi:armadillo repeat-containing protein 8